MSDHPTASRFAGLKPQDEPTLRDKLRALNRARREAGEVSILRGTALLLGVAGLAAIVCAAF